MTESIAGFNWDEGNLSKCRRHGVTIDEIEAAFRGVMRLLPDAAHSVAETRYLAIGRSISGRHLLISITYRQIDKRRFVRPISARFMHAKEVRFYEEQIQTPETSSPEE